MTMSKGAVGNLINRYRAVLKKCHMLNVFGSLAVAGMSWAVPVSREHRRLSMMR